MLLPLWMRVIGFIGSMLLIVSSFFILTKIIDKYFFVSVPKYGGSLNEGIVGRPRLINPVIAKTEVDRDLVSLIYSGLMRASGDTLENDLADKVNISEDGKTYTITLKDNAYFHDGTKVTSDDVVFTVERIQNKGLPVKSPLAPSFNGVTVNKQDEKTVIFELDKPHSTFTESLTFGILPKHIWEPIGITDFDQTDYNLEPVGSGPYSFKSVERNTKNGLSKKYTLKSFDKYVHGRPYISELNIFFYGSDDDRITAFEDGEISQLASVQTSFAKGIEESKDPILTANMPRIFGLYLNDQKKTIFQDSAVRKALDLAMPREKIVEEVLLNYANIEDSPFPGLSSSSTKSEDSNVRFLEAEATLEKAGWKKNESGILEKTDKKSKQSVKLEFSISLPDIPELATSAQIIKESFDKLGANVEIKRYDLGTFTADILTSREFDTALFGQVTGRNPDPYPFWHSSQKSHGMNIAQYSNKEVDDNITKLSRTFDHNERELLIQKINDTIKSDRPALFTYSPKFIYIIDKSVKGIELPLMTTASERFSNIENWYVSSERIWKFLAKNNE